MRTLLVAAGIHTLDAGSSERALLLDGERIVWVGSPEEAPDADRTTDLGGSWITPAFVDAHVHGTATGLSAEGVDLDGAGSAAEAVDRVRRYTSGAVVLGYRWDDTGWPEGRPMTAAEVAEAAPGRAVLLLRVDGHSCVVDPGTLARLPLERLAGVVRDSDGTPTGWLVEEAYHAARKLVTDQLSERQLAHARETACRRAAALGIGSMHEMGHPGLSGLDDALAWARGIWPVDVLVWWAELDAEVGSLRPGGDLFLDGSIGSRTAAVSEGYRDGPDNGQLFCDDEAVAAFFATHTAAGRGAGVHAIGDLAIEQAIRALERVAEEHGADAVRRSRHRIEHVELPRPDHLERMGRLGIAASMQPVFDELWGGSDLLYARRFGPDAALASNPFAACAAAGVRLAFGSDSTVTPLDPWGAVQAAENHRGGSGLTRQDALAAHVLGGRFLAGQDEAGIVRPGWRADLAVWDADPLGVEEPRALRCLATVVGGHVVYGPTDWQ